ncbi:MAG: TetR/AcrR family transcriptional regulator [Clostridia bacterium]|nr:TetR/AcrR family transcriptional regulator [Clostridia bacterium]
MPKVIKDLDKKIIEVATKQLFEKGYAKMTMRSISDECGIAVGTLYNYYKSKDVIVADVMLVDWSSMIKSVSSSCLTAASIHDAFKYLYDGVISFSDKYTPVWHEYGNEVSIRQKMPDKFDLLTSQLAGILNEVLVRCHDEKDEFISVFLAEVILNAATKHGLEYSDVSRVLHRMF